MWFWEPHERLSVMVRWGLARERRWEARRRVTPDSRLYYVTLGRLFVRVELVSRAWWARYRFKVPRPRG